MQRYWNGTITCVNTNEKYPLYAFKWNKNRVDGFVIGRVAEVDSDSVLVIYQCTAPTPAPDSMCTSYYKTTLEKGEWKWEPNITY